MAETGYKSGDWKEIKHISEMSQPKTHSELFKDEQGTLNGIKAKILVNSKISPKFCKTHPLPFATKSYADTELDRLEKVGIITPIRYSEWAVPVAPVVKQDNIVRLCGDNQLTVNQPATSETYPLPRIQELLALSGGTVFSKTDFASAYQQVLQEDESKKLLTSFRLLSKFSPFHF